MDYSDYLKSNHWEKTRKNHLIIQPQCVFCGSSKNLHIHHKAYKIKNDSILYSEQTKNLYTVCSSCHRLVHFYFGINVKKLNKRKLRVRRLIDLGIQKNKAFWIAANPEIWKSFYPVIRSSHE